MTVTSSSHINTDPLLSTKEAARFLSVSEAFLTRDRWAGARNGAGAAIPYVKIGSRAVRYRTRDLLAHIEANLKFNPTPP